MLEVRDPADVRSVVAEVPAMTAPEVAAAYDRARAAFEGWRRVSPLDRATVLARAAGLIRLRAEDGAVTLVRENGKTLAEARAEVTKTADFLDYYASFARRPWGELLSDARPGTSTSVRVEPVGVVLAICPWNDPLITPARKLAPALIAGNVVVLKAASQTPSIALWAAGLLAEAGLPEGVLQVITGRNSEISDALQAELGGKNVSVVLGDADLDMAASVVANAAFAQAGQRCTATSRLIVDVSVAEALESRLRGAIAGIVVGPGLDPATTMGPLSYAAHRDGVLEHIEQARKEGASVLAGGGRPSGEALSYGCYVEPTLISVTPSQSLWRDEVFGPVLAITTATGFDDAVGLANGTAYGLSAAVFTTSLTAANKFIEQAEAGQVAVNLPTAGWDVHHPFGGFRESGSAFKEQGSPGLRFYTRLKTAAVRFAW